MHVNAEVGMTVFTNCRVDSLLNPLVLRGIRVHYWDSEPCTGPVLCWIWHLKSLSSPLSYCYNKLQKAFCALDIYCFWTEWQVEIYPESLEFNKAFCTANVSV